jgi:hypothetical protein
MFFRPDGFGARNEMSFWRPADLSAEALPKVEAFALLGPAHAGHYVRRYSFTQVTSDQMRGTFTFSIDTGFRSACTRNAGRSRSDLKPR